MTPPLFFADAGRLRAADVGDPVMLDGPEGRHAATVRRLSVGERLDVSDGAGLCWCAEVAAVRPGVVEARLLTRVQQPRPMPRLTVVQALTKRANGVGGGRDEQAVETMTEVGVDTIVPWQAGRSIVRWDAARAAKGVARWRRTAREAAKQARRAWLPDVTDGEATADVVGRLRAASTALVLHESADRPLRELPVARDGGIVVVVGPEGGLTDDELAMFEAAGASAVRLGPTVMRASTAGTVAAAVLLAHSGRWG